MEEWIEQLPAVASWLARYLELPQGPLALDQFWSEWRTNGGQHTIPVSLITNGRKKELDLLSEFLTGQPGVFSLEANSKAEALAFTAAVIEKMESGMRDRIFSRSIIVDDPVVFRDLSANPDSPVFQIGTIWYITSPPEIWSRIARYINGSDLSQFRNALLLVTGEPASANGKLLNHSGLLKKAIAENLILIAVFGEPFKLSSSVSPQLFADRMVHELFEGADGDKWCSLANILPILSEASPESFLQAVETSLSQDDAPIMEMFNDYRLNCYTGLLWALENLVYSNEYLSRVTLILGKLCDSIPA